jgi:ubiquinone/menaquinone biosynthesis C-methylase UbiE
VLTPTVLLQGIVFTAMSIPLGGKLTRVSRKRYVPAAGRASLTSLYDPVVALTMREGSWRPALVSHVSATLPLGGLVVDVGAGTGSFALGFSATRPDASVLAVDGDPRVLDRARDKDEAGAVEWRHGLADAPPLEGGRADAVVMSLLLHHLEPAAKHAALCAARGVLRPSGWLHIADWGRPRGALPRAGFALLRLLDGWEGTRAHADGKLTSVIADAGFDAPVVWMRQATAWGTLELLSARRPAAADRPPVAGDRSGG